ncbi:hypothetical protein N665_0157s0153 [Sinapis alba]|nr:hypothetical protein N665_0157s0153 [Sinapis alba]
MRFPRILLGVILLFTATPPSLSQLPPTIIPPALLLISPSELCNGIFLSYTFILGRQIPPNDTTNQAYRFESVLTVLNNGREELKQWRVFVGFRHHEILIYATNAIIVNGTELPALVGTQFMVTPPEIPMPSNISLPTPPSPLSKREITTCCKRDPSIKVNTTTITDKFLPRQPGDLTIMYEVVRAYDQNYLAEVTMENHNPLGRLDHWELSFDWMRDGFIQKIQGACPTVVDATKCIFGPQSKIYTGLDFSDVLTCKIPSCCRNGTILPRITDPSKSASVFTMQVSKMPLDFNRLALFPSQSYHSCMPPVRVSPSLYPDPSGMPTNKTSFASWQIICNITNAKTEPPKCCVSFSAFFNDSIIPCNTCACDALLLPFENITSLTVAWNTLKHKTIPNPMPCGDNCGVSINWHMADYKGGWTARITIFNWEKSIFSIGVNNTIFMEGLPGLEYLVVECDELDPKNNLRFPGKQQSVIQFSKKLTPGINVAERDGFPAKFIFNSEECLLPNVLPIASGGRRHGFNTMVVFCVGFLLLRL